MCGGSVTAEGGIPRGGGNLGGSDSHLPLFRLHHLYYVIIIIIIIIIVTVLSNNSRKFLVMFVLSFDRIIYCLRSSEREEQKHA